MKELQAKVLTAEVTPELMITGAVDLLNEGIESWVRCGDSFRLVLVYCSGVKLKKKKKNVLIKLGQVSRLFQTCSCFCISVCFVVFVFVLWCLCLFFCVCVCFIGL